MVVVCEIEFDKNPNSAFYSGQAVSGTVVLELDKTQEIKALILRILGFAHTDWTEGFSDDKKSYYGHKDYIKSLTYLIGSEKSEKCTIQAGIHRFTFVCELPADCPPSFESCNGTICYSVNVEMVRPWKMNKNFAKKFTVINHVDLNGEAAKLTQPLKKIEEKTLWSSITSLEPMHLEVTLPRTGFVPHQNIPVEILVKNNSSVPVKKIRVQLVKNVTCYESEVRFNSTTDRSSIAKLRGEGLPSHCTKLFNFELLVPETTPTFSNNTTLVDISYDVQVSVVFFGLHTDLVAHLPITIGTVPFTTSEKSPKCKAREAELVSLNNSGELPSTSVSVCLAPPSYEEATRIDQTRFEPSFPASNISDTIETGTIRKALK